MIDFKELSKIDVSNYIEKKGKLSYLSWPVMVSYLRENIPDATVQARKFESGRPYILTPEGGMVETYIELEGKELWSEWLPVMDNRNKAMKEPDMFDINKAIQRCKAKCISEYLGIGLYIYKGEDLPGENDPEPVNPITVEQAMALAKRVKVANIDEAKFLALHKVKGFQEMTIAQHAKAERQCLKREQENAKGKE